MKPIHLRMAILGSAIVLGTLLPGSIPADDKKTTPTSSEVARPPENKTVPYDRKALLDFLNEFGITSAIGAIFGGFVTYRFNATAQKHKDLKEQVKEKEQQLFDGLRAQFALSSQVMWAKHLRADYLEPARTHPQRHELRAYDAGLDHQSVDFASVSFMLEDEAGANILSGALHAEALFRNMVSLLRRRNQLREEYRHTPTDPALGATLTTATNDLYNHTYAALDELYKQFMAMGDDLRRRFPSRSNLVLDIEKDW